MSVGANTTAGHAEGRQQGGLAGLARHDATAASSDAAESS